MPTLTVEAVLFDLDGTLVDSTASVMRNWGRIADRLGRPGENLVANYQGMTARTAIELVAPDLDAAQWDELAAFVLEGEIADTSDVVPMPGALELVAALPADRWGVVTSGTRRLATARLAAAGIPAPAVLITADDITRGKPDPEPFANGARAIGHPATDCLAVEDAFAGIASAAAAGCPVLAVQTTYPDVAATVVVPDLSHVRMTAGDDGRITLTY
jgi:mannitol-1-/sugar-/sorbitol-6-phosphatase